MKMSVWEWTHCVSGLRKVESILSCCSNVYWICVLLLDSDAECFQHQKCLIHVGQSVQSLLRGKKRDFLNLSFFGFIHLYLLNSIFSFRTFLKRLKHFWHKIAILYHKGTKYVNLTNLHFKTPKHIWRKMVIFYVQTKSARQKCLIQFC